MEELKQLATDSFTYWRDNSTQEQKDVGHKEIELYNDPEFAQKAHDEFVADFKAADANTDGILTMEEFSNFYKSVLE